MRICRPLRGLGISPALLLTLTVFAGVTLGGLAFVIQENFLTTAFAFLIGAVVPTAWAIVAAFAAQYCLGCVLPDDEVPAGEKAGL